FRAGFVPVSCRFRAGFVPVSCRFRAGFVPIARPPAAARRVPLASLSAGAKRLLPLHHRTAPPMKNGHMLIACTRFSRSARAPHRRVRQAYADGLRGIPNPPSSAAT
ncbi:hypothetical protein, partial [Burkholderia cepacia]|uniref:hypothetical protein n=1 Tax=Burkholderia cepacia TaxID=292 RepID=UPI002FE1634D